MNPSDFVTAVHNENAFVNHLHARSAPRSSYQPSSNTIILSILRVTINDNEPLPRLGPMQPHSSFGRNVRSSSNRKRAMRSARSAAGRSTAIGFAAVAVPSSRVGRSDSGSIGTHARSSHS